MDKRSSFLMDYISKAIVHPDVSGFEALELLDVRSRLAAREPLLSDVYKTRLEALDRQLLEMSSIWLEHISEVAHLPEMRRRRRVLPSQWWWYLDEIASAKYKTAVGS